MKLCVISFKACWQNSDGSWLSSGGFPLQMGAICSLFSQATLLLCKGAPGTGGIPLPRHARVVAMDTPFGVDARRKLSVILRLHYYLGMMFRHCREADVIHIPLPGDLPFLGLLVAVALRKKLIARYGGAWHPGDQSTLMNRITKFLMMSLAGGRRVMLVTGEGRAAPAPGMSWLFSSALTRAELASIKPEYSRGLQDPARLAFVGRLSHEKGAHHLLEALAILHARNFTPMPCLTLIGDGPQKNELQLLVDRLGLGKRVRFAGQLDRSQLSAELLNCDVAVQPSLTEGYCKAWLDALAHGLPVLSTSVGAAASVIGAEGERGWLTEPANPECLADQLQQILADPRDWPALRRRCRHFAEGRTLEAWAEQIGKSCSASWAAGLVAGRLQ